MEEAFWFMEHADFWYPPQPLLVDTVSPCPDVPPRPLSRWEQLAENGLALFLRFQVPIKK